MEMRGFLHLSQLLLPSFPNDAIIMKINHSGTSEKAWHIIGENEDYCYERA